MKKCYYLCGLLFSFAFLTSCTNDDDLSNKQTNADDDDGRKGKIASKAIEVKGIATEEEADAGRKGKIASKVSSSSEDSTAEESDGRKGKIATAVGN